MEHLPAALVLREVEHVEDLVGGIERFISASDDDFHDESLISLETFDENHQYLYDLRHSHY